MCAGREAAGEGRYSGPLSKLLFGHRQALPRAGRSTEKYSAQRAARLKQQEKNKIIRLTRWGSGREGILGRCYVLGVSFFPVPNYSLVSFLFPLASFARGWALNYYVGATGVCGVGWLTLLQRSSRLNSSSQHIIAQ